MLGNTIINQHNYVVSDQFETTGSSISSFVFRILVIAIKELKISLDSIVAKTTYENQVIEELSKAIKNEPVSLNFLENMTSQEIIAEFPDTLLQLFAEKYSCSCGKRDEVISMSMQDVKCQNCGMPMTLLSPPIICFSKNTNNIEQQFFGVNYTVCGIHTTGDYSIFVDYEKLERHSEDVFLLEAMKGSALSIKKQAINELTYLKPEKVRNYIKISDNSVRDQIGNISLVCWFNSDYLTEAELNALRSHEEPQIQIAVPGNNQSDNIEADEQVLEKPELFTPQMAQSQPAFFQYTYLVYIALAVILLVLLVLMILLSILIYRQDNTFKVENIVASGISFIGVDSVQKKSDIRRYLNSQLKSNSKEYASQHSLYTENAAFSNAYFDSLQTTNATIGELAETITPSSSSSITINELTTNTISASNATVEVAVVNQKAAFEETVSLSILSGSVENTTTNTFVTQSVEVSNDINCDYFEANNTEVVSAVTSQFTTLNANASSLEANEVTTQYFTPGTPVFNGNVEIEELEINGTSFVVRSPLSSNSPIYWQVPLLSVAGNAHFERLNANNINATAATGTNITIQNLKLSGNLEVNNDLTLEELIVQQTTNTSELVAQSLAGGSVVIAATATMGTYGSILEQSATFNNPVTIGQISIENGKISSSAAISVLSDSLTVNAASEITAISGASASGALVAATSTMQTLNATTCDFTALNCQNITGASISANEIVAKNYLLGDQQIITQNNKLVAIQAAMIKSTQICDDDSKVSQKQ